jgi:hypothetical protein
MVNILPLASTIHLLVCSVQSTRTMTSEWETHTPMKNSLTNYSAVPFIFNLSLYSFPKFHRSEPISLTPLNVAATHSLYIRFSFHVLSSIMKTQIFFPFTFLLRSQIPLRVTWYNYHNIEYRACARKSENHTWKVLGGNSWLIVKYQVQCSSLAWL